MPMPKFVPLDGIWDFFYSPRKFDPLRDPLPERGLFTGKMVTRGIGTIITSFSTRRISSA